MLLWNFWLSRFAFTQLPANNPELKPMKRLIAFGLLAGLLAANPAFGQGYLYFTTGKSQVYDCFNTLGVSTRAATVNTAFLWGPASTTPLVDTFTGMTSTPTNGNAFVDFMTPEGWLTGGIWNAILNDTQFNLAINGATATLATQLCSINGAIVYNGGFAFGVAGSAPSTTYTVYMIGWDARYATPALAAAANGGNGAAVGWSEPFQITTVNSVGLPDSFTAKAPAFGTFGPVPEPATLALAVLGGLSLFTIRQRKK